MSLIETLSNISKSTLNRYRLDILTCSSVFDVEEFIGNERLSTTYRYTVIFTSAVKDLDVTQFLLLSLIHI